MEGVGVSEVSAVLLLQTRLQHTTRQQDTAENVHCEALSLSRLRRIALLREYPPHYYHR
jgi:hypothetical protein